MSDDPITIEMLPWEQLADGARLVREEVFVHEQNVPMELEWDGLDAACTQIIARTSDGQPVGTARMTADGHIGRLAVRAPWRGRGVGAALLRALLDHARSTGIEAPYLHAQIQALDFYRAQGFEAVGEEFMDAGIPHRKMILRR